MHFPYRMSELHNSDVVFMFIGCTSCFLFSLFFSFQISELPKSEIKTQSSVTRVFFIFISLFLYYSYISELQKISYDVTV